jgi:hypothetical protein
VPSAVSVVQLCTHIWSWIQKKGAHMQRRRFLEFAGRLGAGLGVAVPLLGAETLQALPGAEKQNAVKPSGKSGQKAPTLAFSLDGQWSIATDPHNVGREQNWFRTQQANAKTTRVPSIIQETFPAYHGVVWYWKEFQPEKHPYAGGRYLLRFNAVDYTAVVWVNGERVGEHEGGDTPFVLDVTKAILPGQTNHLAVRVLNPGDDRIDGMVLVETPHLDKAVNYSNGNLYDYGGIIDSVELLLTPAVRITDAHIRPDWKTGLVKIRTTVQNASGKAGRGRLRFAVTGTAVGQIVLTDSIEVTLAQNETAIDHEVEVENHHLWDIDDPYVYRLSVSVEVIGVDGSHETISNFGFRDFRIVNGYFRLNNRRIFVKCTHTGNHTPFSQTLPPEGYPDMLKKDLLYAKASGFNMIRFIAGGAHGYQMDQCDELGLLVYQEPLGGWLLKDSPKMKERYEISVREMVLRDRNHPSVAMWGMLNETEDGPVFREAVSALPLVRSLDDTRLVLLSSGRFDGHLEIGSASNPGSSVWEPTWGKEAPDGGRVAMKYPSGIGSGDFHFYPSVPQTPEVNELMRTLGHDSKPIFLSEYGIGSMMNVIHEARMYEQAGIRADAEDYVLMKSMADRLIADWTRFGMEVVYPSPETLLRVSQRQMARHRLLGFNMIRSNPKFCGFNLTGMLDHGMTGEGVWRFWRDWKPGAFDAMQDGWAPVRFCLFVEPTHTYVGRPITLEAVLANEDTLRAGNYSTQFRAWGPGGIAWERQADVRIPDVPAGQDGPLVVPVIKEDVVITGPAGAYEFVPYVLKGISPPETSWEFHLTDPASFPRLSSKITTWGVPDSIGSWLTSRGATIATFGGTAPANRELILVGDVSGQSTNAEWKELAARMARGSTVVFLAPQAFKREKDGAARLPLAKKGRVFRFEDMLYHKECVAKPHRVFEGLQGKGVLDMYYYGPMWPHYLFDGQDTPSEVIASAFATGYSTPGGYASGVLLGSYKFGEGQFIVNSFPILDYIDKHPVADRLLLNLIQHGFYSVTAPLAALPADFETQLRNIGYTD